MFGLSRGLFFDRPRADKIHNWLKLRSSALRTEEKRVPLGEKLDDAIADQGDRRIGIGNAEDFPMTQSLSRDRYVARVSLPISGPIRSRCTEKSGRSGRI